MSNVLYRLKYSLIYLLAVFGYKRSVFNEARKAARMANKPLLNAGCGSAYTELSDVNLDVAHKEVRNFVRGDIQNLPMFKDKQFGAVYASHVLEHVENPDAALRELDRVAEKVFVITPLPLWPSAWLPADHKWVFLGSRKIARNPHFFRRLISWNKRQVRSLSKLSKVLLDSAKWKRDHRNL